MINVYNLFAVQMSHCKLPLPINLHKKIISFVENKYKEGDTISCVKGFQFHEDFDGKKELDSILDNYMKNTHRLQVIYSWLNVLGSGSHNVPHKYTADHIRYAAVYYLSNDNSTIVFVKEDQTFELQPKLFDLLIFPYDLVHYVLPEERQQKRICYAFDLKGV